MNGNTVRKLKRMAQMAREGHHCQYCGQPIDDDPYSGQFEPCTAWKHQCPALSLCSRVRRRDRKPVSLRMRRKQEKLKLLKRRA
jgi:hypothetical protein